MSDYIPMYNMFTRNKKYGRKKPKITVTKASKPLKKVISRVMNNKFETKHAFLAGTVGQSTIGATAATWYQAGVIINGVARGVAINERIGDTYKLIKCTGAYQVVFPALEDALVTEYNLDAQGCRVVFIQLRPNITITEALTAINSTADGDNINPIRHNVDYKDTFTVLKDNVYYRGSYSNVEDTAGGDMLLYPCRSLQTRFSLRPKMKYIRYKPTTSTGTPDVQGAIYCIACWWINGGTSAVVPFLPPTISTTIACQTDYKDM